MESIVDKRAVESNNSFTPAFFYDSARDGMRDLLGNGRRAEAGKEGVLLPAYIGWSAVEGSGVFDPVRESGRSYDFYRLNEDLSLVSSDLEHKLMSGRFQYVVIIHYFGRLQAQLPRIREIADVAGVTVVEDLAHGFYTSVLNPSMRHYSDVAMYSLHKQFPMADGGLVVYRDVNLVRAQRGTRDELATRIMSYDWWEIARQRRFHFEAIGDELRSRKDFHRSIHLLWPELGPTEVPQSLPVLLRGADRNKVYSEMNSRGYGMVSLYHTLIEEQRGLNPIIDRVAQTIINFPVHQDVDSDRVPAMVDCFMAAISNNDKGQR